MSSVTQPVDRSLVTVTKRHWLRPARLREYIVTLILIPITFLWIYPFLWMVSGHVQNKQ